MKIGQTIVTCMMCAVLAVGAAIYAQDSRSKRERPKPPPQEREVVIEGELKAKHIAGHGEIAYALEDRFEYHMADKPVTGAPFSAQVVIENTQTLSNGVHINSKATGALYRDSEGRTRNEEPRDGGPEIVLINDPIAGVAYHLHMFQQTAVKVQYGSPDRHREMEEELKAGLERKHVEIEHKRMAEAHVTQLHSEHRNELDAAITEAQLKEDRQLKRERKVESLGTQSFDGVQAVGTRVTFTFPAGAEGNDQPFDIVTEKWYSPELQTVVMIRRNDPRLGENVYRLTNINRSEPVRSLFEPPSDFRLKEEKTEIRRKTGAAK
jgi:hypothetical protein